MVLPMETILTVTEPTRSYGISTRMLRHYEKLGLMESGRKEDYAYRVYRPEDVRRLLLSAWLLTL